jgi:hypothetical protein
VPEHDSPGPEAAEGAARPEVAVEADLHSLSTEPLTAEGDDIEILRKCVAGLAEEELEHISDGLADVFRDSLQYRLGDELIQSAKNPASLPLLPFRLWQIYQAWNACRRGPTLPSDGLATEGNFHWAKRLSFEDTGAIVQTDFLAGVFFRSLRAFDYQRAHLTLQRIEHLEKQRGEDIALSQRLSTHFPDDMRLALGGGNGAPSPAPRRQEDLLLFAQFPALRQRRLRHASTRTGQGAFVHWIRRACRHSTRISARRAQRC